MGTCLDVETLVAMAEGALDAAHSDTVLAHVDGCAECAQVVANLGALDGPARRVGRYRIDRVIGTGGMGIVYAAYDPQLQRRVAIKLVRPENTHPTAQALALAEARTLARISHPNVVAVFDAGEHGGQIYLACELVDGKTLFEWQRGRDARAIVAAWIQAARGLAAAHAEGVVHRDVKPANVLVGRDGRVRIGDFGIALEGTPVPVAPPRTLAITPQTETRSTAMVAGTPAYMAPEHRDNRATALSDQYSACVAIVEALTGTRPGPDAQLDITPPALAAALARGLRANAAERWPSMDALADALAAATAPPPRRRIAGMLVGALLLALLAVPALRAPSDACTVAPVPERVWAARRAALVPRLPADVTPYVDHWLARWATAAGDVCATVDAAVRAHRRACLDRTLAALDSVLARWETRPPASAFAMYVALDELPHAAWCTEAAVADPSDPVTRAAIARAAAQAKTDRAAAARTLRTAVGAGHGFAQVEAASALLALLDADAVGEAEALAASARTHLLALGGDPELEADLDFHLGGVLAAAGRHDDALAAFERTRQGRRLANGAGSPQEAHALLALAGEHFARDGSIASPRARAAARSADAIWRQLEIPMPSIIPAETAAELIDQIGRMRALAVDQYGPDSESVFDAEATLMDTYVIVDQPETALEHARQALALARRLGLRSARVAYVHGQSALILADLGRPHEGVALARAAVMLASELGVDGELSSALTAFGRTLVETGQVRAARRPLERALALRVRMNESGRFRGGTRFWLAVALWTSEPARARAQATIARDELASFLDATDGETAEHPLTLVHQRRYLQELVDRVDRFLVNPSRWRDAAPRAGAPSPARARSSADPARSAPSETR